MSEVCNLICVPYIDQSVKYPTGCESVSTVMLLQFLEIPVTVDQFIEDYLEKRDFEERKGVMYGPDPRSFFCGSPYNEDSFGCYAPVIVRALKKVFDELPEENRPVYEVMDETGSSLEDLCENYLDKGLPVICWACINMRKPIKGPDWKLYETGENFTWISNEHCMLLVGYDENGYWFNDPYDNNGVIRYPKEVVEHRHKAQHMQAVGVRVI